MVKVERGGGGPERESLEKSGRWRGRGREEVREREKGERDGEKEEEGGGREWRAQHSTFIPLVIQFIAS